MRVGAMHTSEGGRGSRLPGRAGDLDDLADQRIAVGVGAAGGEAEHHVARADGGAVDDLRLLDRADGEAGEVVFAVRVHAGHLGGLAADQRAAGQFAALAMPWITVAAVSTSSLPQAK